MTLQVFELKDLRGRFGNRKAVEWRIEKDEEYDDLVEEWKINHIDKYDIFESDIVHGIECDCCTKIVQDKDLLDRCSNKQYRNSNKKLTDTQQKQLDRILKEKQEYDSYRFGGEF